MALGTVLIANVYYTDAVGTQLQAPIDVITTGIKGIRASDFLANDDAPISFETIVPEMLGATVRSVKLSLSYPDGSLELTPAFDYNGDIGFISWSRIQLALANPSPNGDALVDPPFVICRLHHPNPNPKP